MDDPTNEMKCLRRRVIRSIRCFRKENYLYGQRAQSPPSNAARPANEMTGQAAAGEYQPAQGS
jgi:hypothetical protein